MRTPQKKMMDYCTYCPKMCRFSCPVSEVTKVETHTPWGKMEVGKWILDKKIPLSSDNVLPVYQCVNCLHCQVYCEHGNDVPEALREMRKIAVENYVAPENVYQVGKNFSRYNNPYGVDLPLKKKDTSSENNLSKKEVLFFPSCHTRRFFPKRIATYFELFQKLNIQNVHLVENSIQCCGEPLRALGFERGFLDIAEIQYYSLKPYGTVVTDGPACCHSLRDRYAQHDLELRPKVLHLLEFLDPFFEHSNYRTLGSVKGRLAFHEPSFLARYLKRGELAKKLISQITGFEPVELHLQGKDTLSSGAEGAYEMIFPEIAEAMARRCIEDIKQRRAKKLLTAAANEEKLFKSVARDFPIQDIYEFINEQILEPDTA